MAKLNPVIKSLAKIGLTAKGVVYCLLGLLAFMAAFHLGGQSPDDTDKSAVFDVLHKQTGGTVMLGAIALGLICYSAWRFFQVTMKIDQDKKSKAIAKRVRYIFSGVVYGSIAYQICIRLFASASNSKDNSQDVIRELLTQSYGQVLVGTIALGLLINGLYQIYYGLSEKYKDHVDKVIGGKKSAVLLNSGKFGYTARGVVWLLMAFLFFKAAINSNASHAGDTSKALGFLENSSYGSYLLAAVAVGLVCYGTFCFVRARYEHFT